MADSVDIVEASRNKGAIQSAIEDWLADSSTPSSFDRTYAIKRGENKVMVVIEYTAA